MNNDAAPIDWAVSRFARSGAALAELRPAVGTVSDFRRGEQILAEGAAPTSVSILCTGLAKCYRTLPDSSHQTLALYVPGDVLDADAFLLGHASAAVSAITPVRAAMIPNAAFREAIGKCPEIAMSLLRSMARERAMLQEWLASLGRRPARTRTAHLICEISARMNGLDTGGDGHSIPLSQIELADLLGLSSVHVNRVLQQLRADGLVEIARGRLFILNRTRLAAIAGFDARYLGDPA